MLKSTLNDLGHSNVINFLFHYIKIMMEHLEMLRADITPVCGRWNTLLYDQKKKRQWRGVCVTVWCCNMNTHRNASNLHVWHIWQHSVNFCIFIENVCLRVVLKDWEPGHSPWWAIECELDTAHQWTTGKRNAELATNLVIYHRYVPHMLCTFPKLWTLNWRFLCIYVCI